MRILIPLRCSKLREIEPMQASKGPDVPTARCAAFRKHHLKSVLKAEKFNFDVLQDAQEDIKENANAKGAV